MSSEAPQQMGSGTGKKLGISSLMLASNRTGLATVLPPVDECAYTPFYCEENVWRLCDSVRKLRPAELNRCLVVFISNQARCVPLWRQRAGKTEDKLVTWEDYHVVFMYQPDERCLVFDMDTDLPFPTYFQKYVTETLRTDRILEPQHYRFFRVLPATLFLQKFACDRRHMRRTDGTWLQDPPPDPPIRTHDCVHNLDEFVSMDMSKAGIGGTVYNLTDFIRCFYKPK
uniref:Protein N-terminal glutamine amidohydrolase n=2 Tax=Hirondellea gigas TaxID=1518452 RepID=A0A6A7G1E3_9CRUS